MRVLDSASMSTERSTWTTVRPCPVFGRLTTPAARTRMVTVIQMSPMTSRTTRRSGRTPMVTAGVTTVRVVPHSTMICLSMKHNTETAMGMVGEMTRMAIQPTSSQMTGLSRWIWTEMTTATTQVVTMVTPALTNMAPHGETDWVVPTSMATAPLMMGMPSRTTGLNGRTPTGMAKGTTGLTHTGMTPAPTTGLESSSPARKMLTNTR